MPTPLDFHRPQSAYDKGDLLQSAAGGYFGPGNAQLPAPPMLMMDRITAIGLDGGAYDKGHVTGELDITPDLWFFACHFPGDPVMPGCLGLDAMWQMIGVLAELERSLITERTRAGVQAAKQRGVKFGPKPKLTPQQMTHARHLRAQGEPVRVIAALFNVHRATLYRALAD